MGFAYLLIDTHIFIIYGLVMLGSQDMVEFHDHFVNSLIIFQLFDAFSVNVVNILMLLTCIKQTSMFSLKSYRVLNINYPLLLLTSPLLKLLVSTIVIIDCILVNTFPVTLPFC